MQVSEGQNYSYMEIFLLIFPCKTLLDCFRKLLNDNLRVVLAIPRNTQMWVAYLRPRNKMKYCENKVPVSYKNISFKKILLLTKLTLGFNCIMLASRLKQENT